MTWCYDTQNPSERLRTRTGSRTCVTHGNTRDTTEQGLPTPFHSTHFHSTCEIISRPQSGYIKERGKMNSFVKSPAQCIMSLIFPLLLLMASAAEGKTDYEVGTGIGLVSGSPSGTNFAESFQFDWYVNKEGETRAGRIATSIGPYLQFVPPGSYTQIAGAMVSRLHWHFLDRITDSKFRDNFLLVPFLGLGGVHAELKDTGGGTSRDMSYYSTLGLSLDFDFYKRYGLSATFVHNFHDLNPGNGLGHDRGSEGFFFSVRFRL